MKKIICLTIGFCLLAAASNAQDLNGFWKGTFNLRGCFTVNNIELQLTMNGVAVAGDSYHYQDIDNYVKKTFTGNYDRVQKKLLVQEGLITTYHIPDRCVVCVKEFSLVYSKVGNVETLKGLWGGNVLNSNFSCGTDSIILTRIKESAFKEIPEIKTDTGTIRLDFYDNAEIDGDSITVKVNNQVVISQQRLSAKPLTTFIHIDPGHPFHEVEMIAENLGSIPPNTAMLIITAGKKKHRLSLSSAETKSARVRIVYEAADESADARKKYSLIKTNLK